MGCISSHKTEQLDSQSQQFTFEESRINNNMEKNDLQQKRESEVKTVNDDTGQPDKKAGNQPRDSNFQSLSPENASLTDAEISTTKIAQTSNPISKPLTQPNPPLLKPIISKLNVGSPKKKARIKQNRKGLKITRLQDNCLDDEEQLEQQQQQQEKTNKYVSNIQVQNEANLSVSIGDDLDL